MSAVETLKAARALITPEGAWTRHWFAHDIAGIERDADSADATCWCAWGALLAVAGEDKAERGSPIYKALSDVCGGDVDVWNDAPGRTQAEVLAAFDEAIRRAEAA